MGASASIPNDIDDVQKQKIVQHLKREYDKVRESENDVGEEKILEHLKQELEKIAKPKEKRLTITKKKMVIVNENSAVEEVADSVQELLIDTTQNLNFPGEVLNSPGATTPTTTFRRRRLSLSNQLRTQPKKEEFEPTVVYRSQEMGEVSKVKSPFPESILGTFSCHGIEPSWTEMNGVSAKINQDRGCVVHPYCGSKNMAFLAVFDGHGEYGDKVSQYAMNKIQEKIEKHPVVKSKEGIFKPDDAFTSAYAQVDSELAEKMSVESMFSGTTAVSVLIKEKKIWTGNAGDSRCVLARQKDPSKKKIEAIDLTRDHNPNLPDEEQRIRSRGGYVSPPPEPGLSARVWLDPAMTQIGLAMSRSIGDHAAKTVGVISDPEIKEFDITDDDKFLIMASDGVWEFIESSEAVNLVWDLINTEKKTAVEACQKLIETAASRWRQYEGDYRDDITAIVLKLPCFEVVNLKKEK